MLLAVASWSVVHLVVLGMFVEVVAAVVLALVGVGLVAIFEPEALLVHCFPLHAVVMKPVGASISDKNPEKKTRLNAISLQ